MGALLRGKMLDNLECAHARGLIELGDIDLSALHRKAWVVYAKRPFGGPEHVLRYLGRYPHRVGISNQRLVSLDQRGVTFRTKDGKSITIAPVEMLARFAQHVLPSRFVKIRHYGLHAASNAKTRLELARQRLPPAKPRTHPEPIPDAATLLWRLTGIDMHLCPACHEPTLVRTPLLDTRCRAPPARVA